MSLLDTDVDSLTSIPALSDSHQASPSPSDLWSSSMLALQPERKGTPVSNVQKTVNASDGAAKSAQIAKDIDNTAENNIAVIDTPLNSNVQKAMSELDFEDHIDLHEDNGDHIDIIAEDPAKQKKKKTKRRRRRKSKKVGKLSNNSELVLFDRGFDDPYGESDDGSAWSSYSGYSSSPYVSDNDLAKNSVQDIPNLPNVPQVYNTHPESNLQKLSTTRSIEDYFGQYPNIFEALCNSKALTINELFVLAQLDKESRKVVTSDKVWLPICKKFVITKTSDGIITSSTVLSHGYLNTAYATFLRILETVIPVFKDLTLCSSVQCAAVCGRMAEILGPDFPNLDTSRIREMLDNYKLNLIEKLDVAINESEQATIKKVTKDCIDFEKQIGDHGFKLLVVDKLVGESLELDYEQAVHVEFEDINVNEQQIEQSFNDIGAWLIHQKYKIFDSDSSIPSEWQHDVWTRALDKSIGSLIVYLQSILAAAGEKEYLSTVVKINKASKCLSNNSTLKDATDKTDDISDLVDIQIMKPILDEFCIRQSEFIQAKAISIVQAWKDSMSKSETETENYLWRNVPKKSDKRNFMSSFKWAFAQNEEEEKNEEDNNVANPLPKTEFEAQTAVLATKLRGMESFVSIEASIEILELCRAGMHRLRAVGRESLKSSEDLFLLFLHIVGTKHVQAAFEKAIKVLNSYDPKRYGRLVVRIQDDDGISKPAGRRNGSKTSLASSDEEIQSGSMAVEPLAVFTELVNVGDLVQQMAHVFFQEELISTKIIKPGDFSSRSVVAKRKFEQMLDEMLAEGLSRGIDVLMDQVDFTLVTEQLGSDYLPLPTQEVMVKSTTACEKVISLVQAHLNMLRESTEKGLFDVFQEEVGMRLFASLCKHIKRQTISVDGAITLIADINAYHAFIVTLRQNNLIPYYEALKRIAQLFLVDRKHAKQLASAMSDSARYQSLITIDEIVEFVKRRQDWPSIKSKVEKYLYGVLTCTIC